MTTSLFERVSAMVAGGLEDDASLDEALPELVIAELYVFTGGTMWLTGLPDERPTGAVPARARTLAEALIAEHEKLGATWREQPSKSPRDAFSVLAQRLIEHVELCRARRPKPETGSMNDRLDAAFDELNATGIVAVQGAGYTMSDGWSDVNAIATRLAEADAKKRPHGATFFHQQDLERAVAGRGLLLAFGAYEDDDAKHDAASIAVGKRVCEVLNKHGVPTTWDESVEQRIAIPPFEWRKRR